MDQVYLNAVIASKEAAQRRLELVERENAQLRSALELVAAKKRPDGSWNRDRAACQQLAEAVLSSKKSVTQYTLENSPGV